MTDDNLLYYLPPAGEKDEDSASQSMNEDVGTGASDKQHHRGGLCLIERQFKKKERKPPAVTFVWCLVAYLSGYGFARRLKYSWQSFIWRN